MNELIVIDENSKVLFKEEKIGAAEIFEDGKSVDIVDHLKEELGSEVFDVETEAGRSDIKERAKKIKKWSKSLYDLGVDHNRVIKLRPQVVDASKKKMKDDLDQFADKVRKPLTEWEAAEKKRFDDISARIDEIDPFNCGITTIVPGDVSTDELKAMAEKAALFVVDDTLEEQQKRGAMVKDEVILKLSGLIAIQMKQEAEAVELERLRVAEADRLQKEREALIAKNAKEEAEQAAKDVIAQTEKDKKAAEQAVIDMEVKAEKDAEYAKLKSDKDAANAVQAEKDRVLAEKLAEQKASEKREANKAHNKKINNAVVKALMAITLNGEDSGEIWMTKAEAQLVVTTIAKKQIPDVTINY